jgi:hypothetical protein
MSRPRSTISTSARTTRRPGVTIQNGGPDVFVSDEFTGAVSEIGGGVSVFGAGGAFSSFLDVGGRWGDDYQSQKASAGVRVHW